MFRKLAICIGFAAIFLVGDGFAADWPSSARSESAIERVKPAVSADLEKRGLSLGDPVFIRVLKASEPNKPPTDGYLEVFLQNNDGRYVLFKTYPVCRVSGTLGPKTRQGDRQAPEGFYYINSRRLNPYSTYHLSMNLGYPNAYDRAHGYTGDYLMIHGECVSIGCFAMTNEGIDEIYALVDAALRNGQKVVRVHSFPFPMTGANLQQVSQSRHINFWQNLKTGWDWFHSNRVPPNVIVRDKKYAFEDLGE